MGRLAENPGHGCLTVLRPCCCVCIAGMRISIKRCPLTRLPDVSWEVSDWQQSVVHPTYDTTGEGTAGSLLYNGCSPYSASLHLPLTQVTGEPSRLRHTAGHTAGTVPLPACPPWLLSTHKIMLCVTILRLLKGQVT
jgi:hypothetical protein